MNTTKQMKKRIAELEEELRLVTTALPAGAVAVESAAPVKRPVGRPARYDAVEELQNAIDRYFEHCDQRKAAYTVPGLALALGFTSRQSLLNYECKAEFVDTLKKAKLRIEMQRAEQLVEGRGVVAGQIFDLKNNFGWKDQQEKFVTGTIDTIGIGLPGMPPAPRDLAEWEMFYKQMIDGRNGAAAGRVAALDVAPV